MQKVTGLWQQLRPLVQAEINRMARGGGATALAGAPAGGVVAHALYGVSHTGTLDPSQAPWVATDIATAVATHVATSDPHTQYVMQAGRGGFAHVDAVLRTRDPSATRYRADLASGAAGSTLNSYDDTLAVYRPLVLDASLLMLRPSGNTALALLVDASGAVTAADDTDTLHKFGRAAVGYAGHWDHAGFAHRDYAAAGGYALLQGASGHTFINAPGGLHVYHRINDTDVMVMNDARLNPAGSILKDLGDYNRKWRTLFAAELYVETLVAQSVLATIGGRIMVAPTVKLIADIDSTQTTIDTDYSSLLNGDYTYMATAPGGLAQIEAMKITSGPTPITGGYRYTVTRALDGTPANSWLAGDALVSLGNAVGKGYIELTSTSTIHNHLGPNITIYTRTGTSAWNDVKPTVSMGNLRSFVDYSSDEAGFAVGNDLTLSPASGFKGSTNDRTNGLRMFNTSIREYQGGALFLTLDTGGLEFSGVDQSYARVRWLTSGETAEIGTHAHGDNYKRMDLRSWAAVKSAVRIGAWNSGQTNSPVAYVEVRQNNYAANVIMQGDVGIGTTAPAYRLDVADRIRSRTGSDTAGMWLSNSAGTNRGFLGLYSDSAAPITGIWNNGIWALLVDSAGKVGVGTASPEDNLHVAGGGIRVRNSGAVGFAAMKSGDASNIGYLEWWRPNGSRAGYMGYGSTHLQIVLESASDLYVAGGNTRFGNTSDLYGAKIQTNGNIHAQGAVTGELYMQVAAASQPVAVAGWCRIFLRSSDNALCAVMPSGNVRVLATN